MKKTKRFLVGMLCALSASFGAFALSACEEDHVHSYTDEVTAPTCTEKGYTTHTCSCGDTVVDTYVDALGHEFTDEVTAPTCTEKGYTTHTCSCGETVVDTYVDELGHEFTEYLSDNNATYDSDGMKTATCNREGCEEKDTVTEENTKLQSRIAFKTLIADGLKVTSEQSLPNSTTEFSFADEIECLGNVSYEVARDKYGESTFLTKVAPLNEGDNTFYVFENAEGKTNVYEITIRRRPMYRVYFYTNGGTAVDTQTVEEDDFATMPESVKKLGYDFMGWDYDFSQAITENIGIDAQWEILPEMQNFEFYSTETTCEITGLVDTTLTEVVIPDFVTSIGEKAFNGCKYLTSITIPDSVTSIGYSAFSGCSSLTSVTIGDSVTIIGEKAFNGCGSLTSVTIPASVSSIGESAFIDVYTMSPSAPNIYYKGTIEDWCKISFLDACANPLCRGGEFYVGDKLVTEIVIPSTITEIKDYAFNHYDGLTSITIPDSVISIGDRAFDDCRGLTSITIPDSVTSIGDLAFPQSLTCLKFMDTSTWYVTYDTTDWKNKTGGTQMDLTDSSANATIFYHEHAGKKLWYKL